MGTEDGATCTEQSLNILKDCSVSTVEAKTRPTLWLTLRNRPDIYKDFEYAFQTQSREL